jgi:hypothetical protein
MSSDSAGDSRRELLGAATALGLGALIGGQIEAAPQDDARVRSRRISEDVVIGSSVAKAPDYDEAKSHTLIQLIEHVFKEDEDPSGGYPVTRTKEFKVKATTKLAIVTMSGVEFWFGRKDQEAMYAASRLGVHAGLEADLRGGTLTVKARANYRRPVKADYEWSWRCHVLIQCFGET